MMKLFLEKYKVWFEEAALGSHLEYSLRYNPKYYKYSRRVILVTFFTVSWLVFSFPFQANATVIESESDSLINQDTTYRQSVENAQSLTVGDVSPQVVSRDVITAVAAPTPANPNIIVPSGPVGTPTDAQAYAHSLVADENEWACLYQLWARESGWRVEANNQGSGAYGIPQALPGSKMASVGDDWQTNYETQIKWGLGYVNGRYGTPCGAWAHSEDVGWY